MNWCVWHSVALGRPQTPDRLHSLVALPIENDTTYLTYLNSYLFINIFLSICILYACLF